MKPNKQYEKYLGKIGTTRTDGGINLETVCSMFGVMFQKHEWTFDWEQNIYKYKPGTGKLKNFVKQPLQSVKDSFKYMVETDIHALDKEGNVLGTIYVDEVVPRFTEPHDGKGDKYPIVETEPPCITHKGLCLPIWQLGGKLHDAFDKSVKFIMLHKELSKLGSITTSESSPESIVEYGKY